ncbi:MAG: NAD(P)H-quinone oxidoreductase [Clostridia bacterium]|nr:NAD(P)H-quinone oxidoreductase [Clostridia bacterium]
MKAILVNPDQSLIWTEVPDPIIRDDEVLVEIHYAALNRADLMQRAGDYPPPPGCPEWMGLEISGYIRQMGKTAQEKSNFRCGDAVCALLGGGGYAEYVAVKYDMLMPVPKGCSLAEAAAMPEAYCTAYLNIFGEGGAKAGDTLLMHAGASGLASVVIPMAKSFGLRVITSVRSTEYVEKISSLGADIIIDTSKEKTADVLHAQLDAGTPVDVAIDCLGGEDMGTCLPYLARGARWIMIAALAGQLTQIDLKNIYVRNVRIIGSTLRSRTPEYKAELIAKLVKDVWPRVESGELKSSIYRIFPITQAEDAHALMASGAHNGKIVLCVKE